MRPLRLTMQAFGPYSNSCAIDFRQIAAGGLFLIHGQTGAGKTSILDGICFALFGTSSGAERSGKGMRCDLAEPTSPTEVSLEFALGSRVYKIVRRPAQEIAKQRGTGTRTIVAEADLFSLEGEFDLTSLALLDLDTATWTPLTSGEKKTSVRIVELLGMTDDQFRQVVVLPQGQFRKFLTAGSEEREKILETLFRTSRYRAITRLLGEKAGELKTRILESRQKLEGLFSSLGVANESEIEGRINEFTEGTKELDRSVNEIGARHSEALARLEKAREANRLSLELTAAQEKERGLESSAPAMEQTRARLTDERRARPVLLIDDTVIKLERECARLDAELATETQKLKAASDSQASLRAKLEVHKKREPEIEKASEERTTLRTHFENARRLSGAIEKAREGSTRLADITKKMTEAETALASLKKAEREASERQLALAEGAGRAETLLAELEILKRERTNLESALRLLTQAATIAKSLGSLESEREKLASELDKCRLKRLERQRAYHLAQAALLARELKLGAPCPVCGSLEHPHPAELAHDAPTQTELDNLENDLKTREERVASVDREIAGLRAKAEALHGEIGRALGPHAGDAETHANSRMKDLTSSLEAKTREIAEADKARQDLELAKRHQTKLVAELGQAEKAMEELGASRENARREHDSAAASKDEIEQSIPPELRDLKAIESRGRALKAAIDSYQAELQDLNRLLEEASSAVSSSQGRKETLSTQVASKKSELVSTTTELASALLASGFKKIEEVRAVRLATSEIERLERELAAFDNERAVIASRLKDLRAKIAVLPEWAFKTEEIESAFAAIDRERTELSEKRATIIEKLKALSEARDRFGAMTKETAEIEKRYAVLGKLAAVANGQPPENLTRVNFPRFVLAAELDEVLEQASRRLEIMSRGRFILRRAQEVDDKRKNAGLDLTVEDSFTGTARPAAYLSGGESFLASLALALGLADVVQSHLGGVRLEAVFVDEGFGTLDPETLELAMKVLSDLQAGGRLVGVISHVPELREQIAERLFVRKSPAGSQAAWERLS